ncbi:hypothetical protein BH10CYA1_BH10CYA1_27510 [soil metagenome]
MNSSLAPNTIYQVALSGIGHGQVVIFLKSGRARAQSNPKLREHALLSFLITNIGDILAIVKSGEDADKGVRRKDLSDYFLFLENAAPQNALSLPQVNK